MNLPHNGHLLVAVVSVITHTTSLCLKYNDPYPIRACQMEIVLVSSKSDLSSVVVIIMRYSVSCYIEPWPFIIRVY